MTRRHSGFFHAVLLLTAAAVPLLGQFDSLVTTYDGSHLYFVSRLRQHGTDQPVQGKAFVVENGVVRPLLIRNRVWHPSSYGPVSGWSNKYDIIGVEVPGDVGSLAIIAGGECRISTGICGYTDQAETTLYGSDGLEKGTFTGRLRLSPNGEWGVGTSGAPLYGYTRHHVVRIATGAEYPVERAMIFHSGAGHDWRTTAVSNNGTAVAAAEQLILFQPLGQTEVLTDTHPDTAAIDAEGNSVVWAEIGQTARGLRVLVLGSDEPVRDLSVVGQDDFAPDISDDSRRILFLSHPVGFPERTQVFLTDPHGDQRRQVFAADEGIRSAVLSGDGKVVWAVTRAGRLIRAEVDGGMATETVIGPTPALLPGLRDGAPRRIEAAPGQVLPLAAAVGSDQTIWAHINESPIPVLGVDNGVVALQVPWETPITPAAPDLEFGWNPTIGIAGSGIHEWEGDAAKLRVVESNPYFVQWNDRLTLAVHEHWDALVTPDQPARPGEIVYLYATGLGSVYPPAATGVPTPTSPLSFLEQPLRCESQGSGDPADVMFAGLAPGTIGYYQVNLRIPASAEPSPEYPIRCSIPGRSLTVFLPVQ